MNELPETVQPALEVNRPADFAHWLSRHSQSDAEIWTILFKKASGKQTVTFDQLLEEALCFGWIDVKTRSVDAERYGVRFVPRKADSNWSVTNRNLVIRLLENGRMTAAGLATLPNDL